MLKTSPQRQRRLRDARAFSLALALVVAVVILAVVLAVLVEAENASFSAAGVRQKAGAVDAAEAGLNAAINALDIDKTATPGPCPTPNGSLNGLTFTCEIAANQLNSIAAAAVADPGAAAGTTVNVPAGSAYVYGAVTGGARPTYVEAVVARATPLPFPGAGISAQANVFYAYDTTVHVAGNVHANGGIYWNLAGSRPLVPPVVGATQGYRVNQLPATFGMNVGGPQFVLPAPVQMRQFQYNALQLAQAGTTMTSGQVLLQCVGNNLTGGCSGNIYVPGDLVISSGIAFVGGGTVYVGGNVTINGIGGLWNVGRGTIIVAGTFVTTGLGAYLNVTNGGELVVFGTDAQALPPPAPFPPKPSGTALSMRGLAAPGGVIYVPFGSALIASTGFQSGALVAGTSPPQSGGDIFLYGGGPVGAFAAFSTASTITDGELRTTSYWEH
jgi:Tfp pilus assembly protein PilX